MFEIDKSMPVMVTGAAGYVAGRLVERLLDEGLTVHATVRSVDNHERVGHLSALAETKLGTIKLFEADLLEEGSFAEAANGCQIIFHTASPFFTDFKDPQKELVDPAVKGTRNVLDAASNTQSVTRVVVTSSCAAVYGDNCDAKNKPNFTMSEADWNVTSSLVHNSYHYSKVMAERAAWEMFEEQNQWALVTINPSFVFGPGVKMDLSSESTQVTKMFGDGSAEAGMPNMYTGLIDVRDLAEAHFRAGFNPEASGRYIISGSNVPFAEIISALAEKYAGQYPLPKRTIPKFLVWLVAPMSGMTRRFASRNIGHIVNVDNSKSIRELGMTYRPLGETVQEGFQQLIDAGVFKK